MNNFACALWWLKISEYTAELSKTSSPDIKVIEKMALEIFNVILKFKQAINFVEGIKIEKEDVMIIYL